jgi:N-acetylmuramoyl-L-alanine amidase
MLVIHFTGGATAASSVEAMRERNVSAHIVVDRDGSVIQCRAFNRQASHAGVSRWVDPHTGKRYDGINSCGIGIEIANAGNDPGALSWARKQPGFASITARHRNGGPVREWENFQAAQLKTVFEVAQLLVARYKLDDVTGHDCIAPERKDDPGPAFPMLELRAACGFTGLPAVHQP